VEALVYQVLATQYDPLGYLAPFTARAKIIIQDLWKLRHSWDEEIAHEKLRDEFTLWESELQDISNMSLPRCFIPFDFDNTRTEQQLHVFSDASERIYGSVAYLRTENEHGQTYVSFVAARSRVAPTKQVSMPRLELCAALTGAQLADTMCSELNFPIGDCVFWSDSSTVITWNPVATKCTLVHVSLKSNH